MSRAAVKSLGLLGAVALGAALSGGVARADDWPQQGGGAARSGASGEVLTPGAAVDWASSGAGPLVAGAVICDGVVVTVDAGGTVRALNEDDGSIRWERSLGTSDVNAAPACARGRVLLTGGDGTIHCLAVEDGRPLWQRKLEEGGPRSAPLVAEPQGRTGPGYVVVSLGFPSRLLLALDLESGSEVWSAELPQIGYSSLVVADGLLVLGHNDGAYEARDLTSGQRRWLFSTGGRVLLSGPGLAGDFAYLLPGGEDFRLYAVQRDSSRWGSDNWTVSLSDPVPLPLNASWELLRTELATSTPVVAESGSSRLVICLVRFDSVLDQTAPWGYPDRWVAHERLIAVDAGSQSVVWSRPIAQLDEPSEAELPPFGYCPTPAVLTGPGGANERYLAVTSSLDGVLRYLRLSDGSDAGSFTLPASERWSTAATPALANGKLVATTTSGRVLAVAAGNNRAPRAPQWVSESARVQTQTPELVWQPAADMDDLPANVGYVLRYDNDGEVLLDYAVEYRLAPGVTRFQSPPLPSDDSYTYAVRAIDPQGALSPWSAPRRLDVAVEPEPATGLVIRAGIDRLNVEWTASLSAGVTNYFVTYRALPNGPEARRDVGLRTDVSLTGLETGRTYEVEVVARSRYGELSQPLLGLGTPSPPVAIAAQAFTDLESALGAAQPGDVIALGEGSFSLPQASLPAGVSLRGRGPGVTIVYAVEVTLDVLEVLSGEVTLRDLTLRDGLAGVRVRQGARLIARNVAIHDCEAAVVIESGAGAELSFVTLVENRDAGVSLAPGGQLALTNSIATRNRIGIAAGRAEDVTSTFNAVAENRELDWENAFPHPTDQPLVPRFVNVGDRNLRVLNGSPTVDQADPTEDVGDEPEDNGGRANLGAYGTTFQAAQTLPLAAASSAPASSSSDDDWGDGPIGCALSPGAGHGDPGLPSGALLVLLLVGLLLQRRP